MTGRSPLHSHHQSLGARFVDFNGWDMPIQYESVLAEHAAVRQSVGVFDVSHLGRLAVAGTGATEALSRLLCNDVRLHEPGRTHYTMMLNEAGGIVDDIIVWRWDEDDYWVLPNASNSDVVLEHIRANAPESDVEDLRPSTALLAVQGPDAPALLESVMGKAPRRFRTDRVDKVSMAGTGYTGERGGEICVAADAAGQLFERLRSAGAVPCGLGSRDTLRLEAGLALWGSDIDASTTPLEAGLDFAVAWDHEFVGRSALERQRNEGLSRRLAGLVMEARGIPRHGYSVRSGQSSGVVTSGNMSPVLETGIALAYMSPPVEVGAAAEVTIRDKAVPARIEAAPFFR